MCPGMPGILTVTYVFSTQNLFLKWQKKKKKEKRDSALNALIFLNSLFSGECNIYDEKKNN